MLQCLDDKDESIRLRALDLIVGMVGNSHHSCQLPLGVFCRLGLPSYLEMSLRDSPVCLLETVQEISCELVRA